jgi:integrating conjugative element protein (TIGR03755 family)
MPASGNGTTLYYHLGGSDAASRAPNPSNLSLHLGLSGIAKFNFSCGKFSATLSLQNALNQFANLGPLISSAVQAGIAALPMYILQRAQPGLYELVQTYIAKAEKLVNMSFQSCESIEKNGYNNPFDQFTSLAMDEKWKDQANNGNGDVVQAKQTVQQDDGANGFTWVFGTKAGGNGLPPAKLVNDTVTASYNLTMMHPTGASASTNYSATGARLSKAFATPSDAATFATDAIGDLEIATCTDGGCPTKATKTSIGLERKAEDEIPVVRMQLATVLATTVPSTTDLDATSAPGVLVTRDLVDALRALPKAEQAIAVERIGQEVSLARTVDRALLVRQLLVTGQTIPEALPPPVTEEIKAKIAQVNRAIDDLMYEARVRKEVISSSASTILDAYRGSRSASATNSTVPPAEKRPLVDGRVQ